MKQLTIFYLILLLLSTDLKAQDAFLPENAGEAINSSFGEINPVLSPDGKTLYFVRVNHPENRYGEDNSQDIWYSSLNEDGTWSAAVRLPDEVNRNRYNALLSLNQKGNKALIAGVYSKNYELWKKRGLSTIELTENGWGSPVKLRVKKLSRMNKGQFSGAFLSPNDSVLLLTLSKKINSKKQDIYLSYRKSNDRYSKPKKLKKINTRFNEEAPFLSSDGKTIYFSSNRRNKHNYDIYKVTRLDKSWKKWSIPTLLSDTINSNSWESYYKTNQRGSTAVYASIAEEYSRPDIFFQKLFEENPFVVVSGKVLDGKTKKPVDPSSMFQILANGLRIDSLYIDAATSEFKAVLPLGTKYELIALAKNYEGKSVLLDTEGWREFSKTTQDLVLDPVDYVTVSGSILVRSNGKTVPTSSNPMVYINNSRWESLTINPEKGTYTVNLPFGKKYQLEVRTTQYEVIPETLDLSNVQSFKEFRQNLFVDLQKTAVITGKIFDKNENKILAKDLPIMINVDESVVTQAKIDPETRTYTLELALGRTYLLNAVASNYYPMFEQVDLSRETERVKVYKDLFLVPIEVGSKVRLNNIFFETGKSTLMPESFEELDRVAKFLKDNPSISIEIGGHTDNIGKADYNQRLSESRAKSVAEYIMLKGTPASAISYKGYGLSKPLADNKTETGRQLNRRVEFTITGK